jgi:hypothetical protein
MTVQPVRQHEGNLFSDQERLAEAERGRRAREEFEKAWEQEIRNARRAANLCVLCGRPLSVLVRISGAIHHAGCRLFTE